MTLATFTDYASLLSLAISIAIWLKLKYSSSFDNQQINIHLQVENGKTYPLQAHIRRKNLTRSEVQGLLGVIPMKEEQKRYKLAYTSKPEFFKALETAQESKNSKTLVIQCSAKEIEQFDIEKLQPF